MCNKLCLSLNRKNIYIYVPGKSRFDLIKQVFSRPMALQPEKFESKSDMKTEIKSIPKWFDYMGIVELYMIVDPCIRILISFACQFDTFVRFIHI